MTNQHGPKRYRKAYYEKNKEHLNASTRAYYQKHKEHLQTLARNTQRERKKTLDGYLQHKINSIRIRAKDTDLTCKQLKAMYIKQRGKCALTGRYMCLLGKYSYDSLSVDRKNPQKGYTIRNVRLVTWQANAARGSGTDAQLLAFCRDVLSTLDRLAGMC